MTPRRKTYRLKFLDTLMGNAPAVLGENELTAGDNNGALRETENLSWPPGALACHLSAVDAGEVAFCIRPNPDRRAALPGKIA
ncbi:hypothetical protein [Roseiarcus sp.]|uniref:hypothetical protein n=1 Tax=Roseiarcus sp. TaxID=1969460 RepID=UPI003F9A3207